MKINMDIEAFIETQIIELARITGINQGNLSKFFSGQLMTERTINRMAEALDMEPHEVLRAVNLRRKKTDCEKSQLALAS